MNLLALGLSAAFAAGMVQGPPEVLPGLQLGADRTTYDPAGLAAARRTPARCEDEHRDPDGAWPVPLTGMADTPSGDAILVATADRADCYYLMRPGTGRLEAIPLSVRVPGRGYPMPGDDAGGLGRAVAQAVTGEDGRFRPVSDVQSLLVMDWSGPPPACAPPDTVHGATLTLLGSGVPTSEPPLGLPGDHPRPALDRPGALFATSVHIDRHGRPIPGCAPTAWPLWSHLLGELEADGLSLPGARPRYDDREGATLDRLGFTSEATDRPLVPRPTSDLEQRHLDDPESLAPVMPVGITDLQWMEFEAVDRQARPTQVGDEEMRSTHAALLVAPGRIDHMAWLLGDRAGWPVLSALRAPALGGAASAEDPWGAVLQHTASHVDQLRPIVQADAVLPPTGARTTVQVSATGAMDPQVFIDAFEGSWSRRQLIKGVPWDAGRQGVAARIERSVSAVLGASGGDIEDVYLPPGAMPPLPMVPLEATDTWVQRWRFAAHGATAGDGAVWIGLGDPVEDRGWRAVLLRLDPAALDPRLGPAEARSAARPQTVRFVQHWRLHDPLLVRWVEEVPCAEADPAGDGAAGSDADTEPCKTMDRVQGRSVSFWSDDFLRFLYRTTPPVPATRGERRAEERRVCEAPPPDGITPIACTAATLGLLEWSSPGIKEGAVEEHAPKYARRVRTWLRYQRARRHTLLTHRADRVHKDQARLGLEEPPPWARRSVDTRLEPQVGALLRPAPMPAAGDFQAPVGATLLQAGQAREKAARAHRLRVPPPADAAVATLPWPAHLTLRQAHTGGDGHLDVEPPLGLSQLVAVDHRVREHEGTTYVTAWCLLTRAVLQEAAARAAEAEDAEAARGIEGLAGRAGDLLVRTWAVEWEGTKPTGLRELGEGRRTIIETTDGMDAFIDFDAERFRKRTKLVTARTWESRWMYRSDDPRILGKSTLTAESKQSLEVQRLIMDQQRWPASPIGLDQASSIEMIDQDNVLVVALGGQPSDLTALAVPVPVSFVEIPLPVDAAFRRRRVPAPIVMQSRLPWLYSPSMVPSEVGWLSKPIQGTLRCKNAPADAEETGVGTPHLGGEPCAVRIGDLQYEPDTRTLLFSLSEPEGVDEWRFYLATLDQSWFSPLATLPVPADAARGTRPALARSFDAKGRPLVGLQYMPTGDALTHAAFHWLVAAPLGAGGERQRVAPCLDPSDTRCNLR